MTKRAATTAQPPPPPSFNPKLAVALIACSLIAFASLAFFAVASKAPTYDEPLHALGAWQHLHDGDYRVNPEDPPLWQYWAALPNGPHAIKADTHNESFAKVADDVTEQWHYVVNTLYRTEGNDGDTFILRSRVMMLIVGVALGVTIACWAWQLAGPFAAVVATAFYCFDPNFLAHAPLVKNDVSLSLVLLGLVWSIWRAGQRMTWWNASAVCLCCAAALNVKFSGVLLGPIAAVLLLIRALQSTPWPCMHWNFTSRNTRLVAAVLLCVSAGVVSYAGTWACYRFRFNGTPDPNVHLNLNTLMFYTVDAEFKAKHEREPTTQEALDWKPGTTPRVIMELDRMHVLPEAWLDGFLYTYQSALARPTFLLGSYSLTGWWYYFPLAMLYKSPVTLLAACTTAIAVAVRALRHRAPLPKDSAKTTTSTARWTLLCLVIPPAIYLLAAMTSNLNLGLRHVLPIYPFIYLGLGFAARNVYTTGRTLARRAAAIFALALATESLVAFPNYIAFFNIVSGGPTNGITLLGDSNLDWGQDLKMLAEWRQKNPEGRLYLLYFGLADPWAYGINDYVNVTGGYKFGPVPQQTNEPGVFAASATMLQGIYVEKQYRPMYTTFRKHKPFAVLGHTIYLYRWPLPDTPSE